MVIIQEVPKPLPICDHCGLYMPSAWLNKHRRAARCEKATEIWLRRRDLEMGERCGKMDFSLYGR